MLVIVGGGNMAETTTNNEGGVMAGVDIKSLIYTQENVEFSKNDKEEYEVLNGMFIGNYAFEERKTLRDLKLSKIIDMF